MNEAALQRAVVELAKLTGWTVAHFRPVRVQRADGTTYHETPAAVDGTGFPDLVLVRPGAGVLFVELKADRGRLRPEQSRWIGELRAAGADARVWRPADWPEIETTLNRRRS